jgi:hypothetical protein
MEMAATAPNVGFDSPTINHVVPNTHVDNVGMPAESLGSVGATLEEKSHSDDEGKTTVCGETRK